LLFAKDMILGSIHPHDLQKTRISIYWDDAKDEGTINSWAAGYTTMNIEGNPVKINGGALQVFKPISSANEYGPTIRLMRSGNDYGAQLSDGYMPGGTEEFLAIGVGLNVNPSENEVMRILSNGNVGIGTTAPGAFLEISDDDPNTTAYIKLQHPGQRSWEFYATGPSGSERDLTIFDVGGGIDVLTLQNGGNVGIGTTNPTGKLHIDGDANYFNIILAEDVEYIQHGQNSGGRSRALAMGFQDLGTAGNPTMNNYAFSVWNGSDDWDTALVLDSDSGNVGIGTTNPSSSLDIIGDLEVGSSDLFVDDSLGKVAIGSNNTSATAAKLTIVNPNSQVGTPNSLYEVNKGVNSYNSHLDLGTGGWTYPVHLIGSVGTTATSYSFRDFILGMQFGATTYLSSAINLSSDTSGDGNIQLLTGLGSTEPVPRLTILKGGNVGIGTTAPMRLLHVEGSATGGSVGTGMVINNVAGATGDLSHLYFAGTTSPGLGYKKAGIFFLRNADGWGRGDLAFGLDNIAGAGDADFNDTDLIIKADGNVGSGTTNPLDNLHVMGAAYSSDVATIRIESANGATWFPVVQMVDGRDNGSTWQLENG